MKIIDDKFWKKVDIRSEDECWEWKGSTNKKGYGEITRRKIKPKIRGAHRYSIYLHTGIHPLEHFVCHTCDNPRCVNPKHLYLGDHASNTKDARERNRFKGMNQSGENNHNAKLTTDRVKRIKDLLQEGQLNNKQIAKKFGCSHQTVSLIRRGKAWQSIRKMNTN